MMTLFALVLILTIAIATKNPSAPVESSHPVAITTTGLTQTGQASTGVVQTGSLPLIPRYDRPHKTKADLTPEQLDVMYNAGTEPPFDNAYRNNEAVGLYVDVIDGTPLFASTDKFDSGTGRPSFTKPISSGAVTSVEDDTLGVARTEIRSRSSGVHLGHVFDDGPVAQGGKRYCMNSAALEFIPYDELEARGYGDYKKLFK